MIELRVLGTLALHSLNGGEPATGITQPKRLALLLYLALAEPSGPQSRESLMALLWPEADDESTRHSLRNAVYGLRQVLGDGAILSRGEGYIELDSAAIRCDAVVVRELLAAEQWKDALARWRGDPAPGFHVSGAPEFERWLDEQRATFRRAVADAGWRRVDEMESGGEAGVGEAARRAWAIDPTNEAGARRLMQLLDATTGRAAALRAYDDLVDYLRREYDAAPSAETRALADRLTRLQSPPLPSVPVDPMPLIGTVPSSAMPDFFAPAPNLRRPLSRRGVRIGAAIFMVAAGSALMLRHAASARSSLDPASQAGALPTRAEQPSALRLPLRFRRDTVAYRSYLRGLALLFRGDHVEGRDHFASLTEREPLYAPAFAGLAHAYALMVVDGSVRPAHGMPKAEAAAQRALALDSAFASTYLALAAVEIFWRWNLPRARQFIDQAMALDPTDPETHAMRSAWFRWRGEMDSAITDARISQRLDPLSSIWGIRLGRQFLIARRYSEAEATFRQTLEDYPPDAAAYYGLSSVYRAMGRMREAEAMRRAAKEVEGDSLALASTPLASSDSEAARMFADRDRRELRDIVASAARGDFIQPNELAAAYASMHDREATLRWLDSMRIERDPMIPNVALSPVYDWLRDDPGYRVWDAKLTWRHPGAAARPDTAATAR